MVQIIIGKMISDDVFVFYMTFGSIVSYSEIIKYK